MVFEGRERERRLASWVGVVRIRRCFSNLLFVPPWRTEDLVTDVLELALLGEVQIVVGTFTPTAFSMSFSFWFADISS